MSQIMTRSVVLLLVVSMVFPTLAAAQGQRDQYIAARDAYRAAGNKASADRQACFNAWATYYQCLADSLGPQGASCSAPTYPSGCPAGAEGASGISTPGGGAGNVPTIAGVDPSTAAALAGAIAQADGKTLGFVGSSVLAGAGVGMLLLWNQEAGFSGHRNGNPLLLWGGIGALAGASLGFVAVANNVGVRVKPGSLAVEKRLVWK